MLGLVLMVVLERTLGSSIYTPAISEIQESFRVSETVAILPLSLYVLALGFGPIIAAPVSINFTSKMRGVYQLTAHSSLNWKQ